jgi:hypothetical protein
MTFPADHPARLSERLKQLEGAQYPGGMPPFDLDAAILGGRQRRRRRTVVATVGAAAAAVVIAANLTLPGGSPETVRPDTPPATAVLDSRQPEVSYRQHEDTVTAHLDGTAVATLTLTSVTYNRSGGQVHLTVTADRDFLLSKADFIWENGEFGTDQGPVDAGQAVHVSSRRPQSVVIDFRWGAKGTVVWAPGGERIAGAWKVSASASPVRAVDSRRATYLQRGDTVSVYNGAALVATLTLASRGTPGAAGQLHLTVNAVRNFSFPANEFIWEDQDGADQGPLDSDRVLRFGANSSQAVEIAFRTPGTGAVIWATGKNHDTVAGAWIADR